MDLLWLAQELEKRGRGSRRDLARVLGLAESAITRILRDERKISSKEADAIKLFFAPQLAEELITPNVDVPVLGTALGGEGEGDFLLNGHALHYVKRPAKFLGRDDVFALYISGSSMEPRYFGGELVFCERRRAPSIGDHVIVEMQPDTEGVSPAYLKRLEGISGSVVKLTQYNPPKKFDVDRKKVSQIIRVLTLADLIG